MWGVPCPELCASNLKFFIMARTIASLKLPPVQAFLPAFMHSHLFRTAAFVGKIPVTLMVKHVVIAFW